ncbi:hypothetical protein ABT075_17980 [Streptomyces sp. NPDC002677]|uniref:hypothetical protein n=1 Tax=Streptomyces sp. NPDC002677 TaxID=3154774 RepID=UPI0033189631
MCRTTRPGCCGPTARPSHTCTGWENPSGGSARRPDGSAPGIWAPEAYDTTRLVADRLTALARESVRRPSRAQVAKALTRARFKGLSTTYAFNTNKELTVQQAYHYRVDGGRFAYVGTLPAS